jgi:hypothetical protein
LQGYAGDQPYVFDRISRGRVAIERVCLSLLGSIQPTELNAYFKGAINGGSGNNGLIQRFSLAVYPDLSAKFEYVDRPPNLGAIDKIEKLFSRLAALEPNGHQPVIWRFTAEAQEIFIEWLIQLEQELRHGDLHPAIQSHLGKYSKLIPALALIFAHIDTPNSEYQVGRVELLRAIAWGEYLRTHAERIYQSAVVPEINAAKRILNKIKANALKDGFTAREITHKNWSDLSNVDAVKRVLLFLVSHDYLKHERKTGGEKGGRPSDQYWINPRFYKPAVKQETTKPTKPGSVGFGAPIREGCYELA